MYLLLFFYRNLVFHLAFVAFITSYIFTLYSGKNVRSDSVIGKECSTETVVKGDVTFLWVATTICWVYLITREFFQFGIAPKRYIFTLGNLLRGFHKLRLQDNLSRWVVKKSQNVVNVVCERPLRGTDSCRVRLRSLVHFC